MAVWKVYTWLALSGNKFCLRRLYCIAVIVHFCVDRHVGMLVDARALCLGGAGLREYILVDVRGQVGRVSERGEHEPPSVARLCV